MSFKSEDTDAEERNVIDVWFACNSCRFTFPFLRTVQEFLEHKKKEHFAEFQTAQCIIFEERKQDEFFANTDSDQNFEPETEIKLFAQDCDGDGEGDAFVESQSTDISCDHHFSPGFSFVDEVHDKIDDAVEVDALSNLQQNPQHHSVCTFPNTFNPIKNPYVLLRRLTPKELMSSNRSCYIGKTKVNLVNISKPTLTKTKGDGPGPRRGPFPCAICSKSFKNTSARGLHMNSHYGFNSHLRPLKCNYPDCKSSFNKKCDLKRHTDCHQNAKSNPRAFLNNHYFKFPGPDCSTTRDLLTLREWLVTQKALEHTNSSDPETVVNVIRLDPDPTVTDEAFKISGKTPIKCKLCSKNLESEAEVKVHAAHCWLRNKLRHVYCLLCDKVFCNPLALSKHNTAIHTLGRKPRQQQQQVTTSKLEQSCPMFPMLTKDHLNRHMETETHKSQEDPINRPKLVSKSPQSWKCDHENCEKFYTLKSSLDRHMIQAHGFGFDGQLPAFECEICKQTFKWEKSKIFHLRTHTEERPFKCHYDGCEKAYKDKISFVEHVRVKHTGEKPFQCELCGKAFCRRMSLRWHMGMHKRSQQGAGAE